MRRRRREHGLPLVAAFDLLTCLLLMFVILALVSKPKAQPPHIKTFGVYAVTATWAAGSNDDVDLYVQDPAGNIAYFQSATAGLMHLEHDDLGTAASGTQVLPDGRKVVVRVNGERTVLTGTLPGEYTVNVHMFSKLDAGPTPVVVQLWLLRGNDRVLVSQRIVLTHVGQEETAFRFTLNAAGDAGGFNRLPKRFVGQAGGYAQPSSPVGRGGL